VAGLLARAVEQVYSIQRDDQDLRQIVREPPDGRGRFFDALRKHYPVRREFHNTTVSLDKLRESLFMSLRGAQRRSNLEPGGGRLLRFARNDSESLTRKLRGLGFKVEGGQ